MQLVPPTSINSNGTSTPLTGMEIADLDFQLQVTQIPTGGAPTLDVYLQTSLDGGFFWSDIAHTQFTTVPTSRFGSIADDQMPASNNIMTPSDGALVGEKVVPGLVGDQFRCKWVFAAGGSTGSYVFQAFIHAEVHG